ncbi:MAG: hypothetical protein IT330_05350 [Anaerolineae bacterium]|nr:hypothetical protein [Anaerolineae bacterium]
MFIILWTLAAGERVAPPIEALASPETLADLPLVQAANVQYVGAFRVPNQDGNGNPLGYSGHALGYNPANHALFFGGHDWYQELCEVGIPITISLSSTAPILQNCTDVTEGRLGQVDDYTVKLGGTLVYNGRLIVSAFSYYDADGNQVLSHFASTPNLAQTGDVQGPYQVGDWAGIVSGYMGMVPPEWRSALGGPALTGQCCISIISRTSAGPAVSVFEPDDVGRTNPVTATALLYYPLSHPLAPETTQNGLFNLATAIKGVAFPPGTRSVLFFGRHGTGPYCYGTGEECNDPVDSSKGTHSYPYVHQVWAYDALDLLAVKNGQMEPWEVRPYATWQLNEMDATGGATIRGATYDPASGRVYITEGYGEEPVVHVYQITVSPTEVYLPLVQGWNLISLSVVPANPTVPGILASIAGQYDRVLTYMATDAKNPWKMYGPTVPPYAADLTAVDAQMGLWVHTVLTTTLHVTGTAPAITGIPLRAGWNLVGYPRQTAASPLQAFGSLAGCLLEAWAYEPGPPSAWSRYVPGQGGDPFTLQPGRGYWLRTSQACTWALP